MSESAMEGGVAPALNWSQVINDSLCMLIKLTSQTREHTSIIYRFGQFHIIYTLDSGVAENAHPHL